MGVECELTFDGISSKDIGVTVEGYPGSFIPERNYETVTIPGRNGDLIYDYGTYKNYPKSYTIHWRYIDKDDRIAQWLCKPGYRRLEDSFHPEHFCMAHYNGLSEVDNRMQVLKRAQIEFTVKPQWFRKTGNYPINVSAGDTIVNTGMPSKPLIIVTGSDLGLVTVNGIAIFISDIPTNGIVIDCELQDAYSVDKLTNLNSLISLPSYKFPQLNTGKNNINYASGVKNVKICPRWWDIF